MSYRDWQAAGRVLFPLYPIVDCGRCGCGNPDCRDAGKHPSVTAWQKERRYTDQQLEVVEMLGYVQHGWGARLDGLLVVDIDPRNGGERQQAWEDAAGLVVATGGGGWHYYFLCDKPITSKIKMHKGIDFLSGSGHFVVGPGSEHKSGNTYSIAKGSITAIGAMPADLAELVESAGRVQVPSATVQRSVALQELRSCVMAIPNDDSTDYDRWVTVGMAIHHATGGSADGFTLWAEWSAQNAKSTGKSHKVKWRSFGKAANPVTYATLVSIAEDAGWVVPVTFDADLTLAVVEDGMPFDVSGVDLLNPPGLVGEVATWIDRQCQYPRQRLAVAAAIQTVADIGGLRHILDDGMTKANLNTFCVAASATGKEAVIQARLAILSAVGVMPAHHGAIKSEQEMIKNITRHQAAYYTIDEVSHFFKKVNNSGKSGASYLEGVLGAVMSIYSKSNGIFGISGDLKESCRASIKSEIRAANESELSQGDKARLIERLNEQLHAVDKGIVKPFVSLLGFTTPSLYEQIISHDTVNNGFLGRALFVEEAETNPRPRADFKPTPLPMGLQRALVGLRDGGDYSVSDSRVEFVGECDVVTTDAKAREMVDAIAEWQWQKAEDSKDAAVGLEATWRRTLELVNKVSLALAMGGGVRLPEHVAWAFEFVRRINEQKINLALSLANTGERATSANLLNKILAIVRDEPVTEGVIVNRCRPFKREDVLKGLQMLVSGGTITKSTGKGRHKNTANYKKAF
jgi:hypothetical protein